MSLPEPSRSNVKYLPPAELELFELLQIGRALKEEHLKSLGLYDLVRSGEKEAFWRLAAAAELLVPLRPQLEDLAWVREQYFTPVRGSSRKLGGPPQARGRTLPPAGTIIEVNHRFQRSAREGGRIERFRFLVVDPRGQLMILNGWSAVIYGSPSSAAKGATGNKAEQGWTFFGVT